MLVRRADWAVDAASGFCRAPHPKRGLLILEVKDWKLDTIQSITKSDVSLLTPKGLVHAANPLEQARQYAHALWFARGRSRQLVFSSGRMQGKLLFPWAYGVVLANISRKQFESTDLGEVLEPHRVICQDGLDVLTYGFAV